MERLTKRDQKGRAYFDDDGALIRGANGTFHQKKDMTAQYIHQRFVALDKAIDCLAAYEDTDLTPEEIMALLNPPNPPLTLDELREMDGEPVWIDTPKKDEAGWALTGKKNCIHFRGAFSFDEYGYTWNAYRRKPKEA